VCQKCTVSNENYYVTQRVTQHVTKYLFNNNNNNNNNNNSNKGFRKSKAIIETFISKCSKTQGFNIWQIIIIIITILMIIIELCLTRVKKTLITGHPVVFMMALLQIKIIRHID